MNLKKLFLLAAVVCVTLTAVAQSTMTDTHVLYVSAKSPDPQEAKMIADAYAQVAREFIATKMDMREPNIFEEARVPNAPVSPQKARAIVIGFLIGALLAMAIIAIRYFSDDRICTTEDITKVGGLTTLGMIPLQDFSQNAKDGPPPSAYGHRSKKNGKEG